MLCRPTNFVPSIRRARAAPSPAQMLCGIVVYAGAQVATTFDWKTVGNKTICFGYVVCLVQLYS
jgi:hypothetical protein